MSVLNYGKYFNKKPVGGLTKMTLSSDFHDIGRWFYFNTNDSMFTADRIYNDRVLNGRTSKNLTVRDAFASEDSDQDYDDNSDDLTASLNLNLTNELITKYLCNRLANINDLKMKKQFLFLCYSPFTCYSNFTEVSEDGEPIEFNNLGVKDQEIKDQNIEANNFIVELKNKLSSSGYISYEYIMNYLQTLFPKELVGNYNFSSLANRLYRLIMDKAEWVSDKGHIYERILGSNYFKNPGVGLNSVGGNYVKLEALYSKEGGLKDQLKQFMKESQANVRDFRLTEPISLGIEILNIDKNEFLVTLQNIQSMRDDVISSLEEE